MSNYGTVESVKLDVTDAAVHMFVMCATTDDVANAVKNLHGRFFGGRVISARPMCTNAVILSHVQLACHTRPSVTFVRKPEST